MKSDRVLNRRVIFKLHGMDPLDATVLKQDATGYWIRGGTLAGKLDESRCSLPESDVRYLGVLPDRMDAGAARAVVSRSPAHRQKSRLFTGLSPGSE